MAFDGIETGGRPVPLTTWLAGQAKTVRPNGTGLSYGGANFSTISPSTALMAEFQQGRRWSPL